MKPQYQLLSKVYDVLDYTYFKSQVNNPRQALLDFIPEHEAVNVLELCVGTATNSILIAKNRPNAKVYGIDRSKEMLNIALEKCIKEGIDNIELRKRDATKTGIKGEQFDYIILSLVLHESSSELAASILSEAKRLLKKNGRILILEWEVPKTMLRKAAFYPIMKLEPKGFDKFVHMDFKQYFAKHHLQLVKTVHCNYSRVFELAKMVDKKES